MTLRHKATLFEILAIPDRQPHSQRETTPKSAGRVCGNLGNISVYLGVCNFHSKLVHTFFLLRSSAMQSTVATYKLRTQSTMYTLNCL